MTNEIWSEVLGDGLAVSLELPVGPSERPITAGDSAAHLLEAIALIEDAGPQRPKDEPQAPDLQRLEVKIDLLTDLVSSLLADRIPRGTPVTVSADGLVLSTCSLASDCDRIEIYPCHWLAQPVVLELGPILVRDGVCGASWRSPDPVLRDAIGRWVFRIHRREVARRRMQGGAVAGPDVSRRDL
ncbi:PilZ domain-containing protein [Imhoffiella purpurea]|uniref:Cyclic di-GMP receptor atypical PilZ domain-containing protein n=1 Tax=Imhoffiella purpurea TaxID=1249627 RepID=W9W2T2_9GAMM|nr:PilZ domain-containing protein [Imhoffiella purpurea]EXJ16865.1 hypothetical protein D779_2476 [Imhoffiella purpurea]